MRLTQAATNFSVHDQVTVETIYGHKPGVVRGKGFVEAHYDVLTADGLLRYVPPEKIRPREE